MPTSIEIEGEYSNLYDTLMEIFISFAKAKVANFLKKEGFAAKGVSFM